jgi:hypothetical protein
MRRTTLEVNLFTAWIAGTGHELDNVAFQLQPWSETLMDLHNNAIGRNAGSVGGPVDPSQLWTLRPDNLGSTYSPYAGVP